MCHIIIHGMWDVFRILEPFDTTKTWDLFHHTARLKLLTVVSHVEELRKTGDKYIINNMDWSGEYLQTYMDLTILTKVLSHVNVDAYRPGIMASLIIFIYDSNFEIMDKVKYKLAATNLSDFTVEDVEL